MAWNDKRVSIIITVYQNAGALPRSLRSVFKQNYPHLEIIVTDDGTDHFDTRQVREMIDQEKGGNIERVEVLHSETNLGTVQNLRRALNVMTGDYYMTIGADDALADADTISAFLCFAYLHRWEPLLLTGQLVLCDENLERTGTALTLEDQAVLKSRDAQLLYSTLVFRCCIATVATLYRRDFPQSVDAYDTDYYYYEDYPSFLRMARRGITPVFIDREMALHPAGGIANGAQHRDLAISRRFYQDRTLMYRREIRPYLHGQPAKVKVLIKQRRRGLKNSYLWEQYAVFGHHQRLLLMMRHPWVLYWGLGKGENMRARLFRIGMACLMLLCALRASGLFAGWPAASGELILAFGAILTFGASLGQRVVFLYKKCGDILDRARTL